MNLKTALGLLKIKFNAATSFTPELYDLLSFHGCQRTALGRMANFTLKAGFKFLSYLKSKKSAESFSVKKKPHDTD
ncbi:MAG: hypothetical protein KAI35_08145, partial [Desulfobulbaceae bacterium]|nr:hypothetical protein [Desulfobulbaceae bacterium]